MTTTYTNTLLTWLDRARFQIGDTDITDALLSDEEIAAALTIKGNEDDALVFLANASLAAIGSMPSSFSADGVRFDFSAQIAILQSILTTASSGATSGIRIRRMARPQLINGGSEYS